MILTFTSSTAIMSCQVPKAVGAWRPTCPWGPKEATHPFLEGGRSRKSAEWLFPIQSLFSYKNTNDGTKLSIPGPRAMVLNCNEPGFSARGVITLPNLITGNQPRRLTVSGACSVAGGIFFHLNTWWYRQVGVPFPLGRRVQVFV